MLTSQWKKSGDHQSHRNPSYWNCPKLLVNPSSRCQAILYIDKKSRDYQSLEFILSGPSISVPNFMVHGSVHPMVFHSEPQMSTSWRLQRITKARRIHPQGTMHVFAKNSKALHSIIVGIFQSGLKWSTDELVQRTAKILFYIM